MINLKGKYSKEVIDYVESIKSGKKVACKETIQGVERFINDLKSGKFDFNSKEADLAIEIIETQMKHRQGETITGVPLMGKPLLLQPWQKYVVYNLLGFYKKGTQLNRFTEAFIFIPRKNGKTMFIAALAWALAIIRSKSGSSIYIIAGTLKQARESFDDIKANLTRFLYTSERQANKDGWKVLDNNNERSVEHVNINGGTMKITAIANNMDRLDSLNSNIQICDELHAYPSAKPYITIKDAGKGYANRLCLGISTAGDSKFLFCRNHLKACQNVLNGSFEDDQLFVFICKADEPKEGELNFLDPIEHEKANPSYNVTVSAESLMTDAAKAENNPMLRNDFLSKSLNVYTSGVKSYFDIASFRNSDELYNWSMAELAKLPIKWFGGADLSKLYDLTAAALYGHYKGVDIAITHGFFPITQAQQKAEQDGIPVLGWIEDGTLTATNSPTVNYSDVVNWFLDRKQEGFNIAEVGFDRKFAQEFFDMMKGKGFKMVNEPQLLFHKSQGFKRIEKQALDGKFYYLHSEAFEYCVENVHAVAVQDDAIKYEKVSPHSRIDLFDASVFACMRLINNRNLEDVAVKYLGL